MVQFSQVFSIITILALPILAVSGAPGNYGEDLEGKQDRPCQPGWSYNGRDCVHRFCGVGFYWNGHACADISSAPGCPAHYYWNDLECVRSGGGGHNCADRHYWNGRYCVLDLGAQPCLVGNYWNGEACVPFSKK